MCIYKKKAILQVQYGLNRNLQVELLCGNYFLIPSSF